MTRDMSYYAVNYVIFVIQTLEHVQRKHLKHN